MKALRAKGGNASLIPMIMLSAVIAVFYSLSQSSFDSREKQIRAAEKVLGIKQLEARLRGALDDPEFIYRSVFVPNVNPISDKAHTKNKVRTVSMSLLVEAFKLSPENFVINYPQRKKTDDPKLWVGSGSRLSYPSMELCESERDCPLRLKLENFAFLDSGTEDLIEMKFAVESLRPDLTGPWNSKSDRNRFSIVLNAGRAGLIVKESSLYCDNGYALLYMHMSPLEVTCRPLR